MSGATNVLEVPATSAWWIFALGAILSSRRMRTASSATLTAARGKLQSTVLLCAKQRYEKWYEHNRSHATGDLIQLYTRAGNTVDPGGGGGGGVAGTPI